MTMEVLFRFPLKVQLPETVRVCPAGMMSEAPLVWVKSVAVKVPPDVRDRELLDKVQLPLLLVSVPVSDKVPVPLMVPRVQVKLPPMAKFPAPVMVVLVPLMSRSPKTVRFAFSVTTPPPLMVNDEMF